METLRFYRRLRDVEQKDLATLLGVTTSMISRYEQGKADIRADDLFKIRNFSRYLSRSFLARSTYRRLDLQPRSQHPCLTSRGDPVADRENAGYGPHSIKSTSSCGARHSVKHMPIA